MTDYKNNQPPRPIDKHVQYLQAFALLAALVMTIGVITTSCIDAIVKTVETEEEQRIYKVDHPKAYRMQSPTPDQMEAYHHLMQVQEVRR